MPAATRIGRSSDHNWMTLNVIDTGNQFILEEPSKLTSVRITLEILFSVLVGVLLLSAYLIFVLPDIPIAKEFGGVSVSVGVISIALVLYSFATRGFSPQVGFDKTKKELWICKLNSKGQARVVTRFPKADLRSIYVLRSKTGSENAALVARFNGKVAPVKLLTGSNSDIESAHHELSLVLREEMNSSPEMGLPRKFDRKSQSVPFQNSLA